MDNFERESEYRAALGECHKSLRDFTDAGHAPPPADCVARGFKAGFLFARATITQAAVDHGEPDLHCFICGQPLIRGQMVLPDVTEGLAHRECYGNDRDAFVKDVETGEPLGPDDPLPEGYPYEPMEL